MVTLNLFSILIGAVIGGLSVYALKFFHPKHLQYIAGAALTIFGICCPVLGQAFAIGGPEVVTKYGWDNIGMHVPIAISFGIATLATFMTGLLLIFGEID